MMPINPETKPAVNILQLLKKGAILLDVRTQEEFVGNHLEGAVNIPLSEIEESLALIRKWERPVVVYSAKDQRSRQAAIKLHNHGIPAFDAGPMDSLRELLIG